MAPAFQFQVGDIVEYKRDKCEAVVKDVLSRGVDILRRTGPSKGVPRFVQPQDLELIRRPRAPKAKAVEPSEIPAAKPVVATEIAGDAEDIAVALGASVESPAKTAAESLAEAGDTECEQLSLLGF